MERSFSLQPFPSSKSLSNLEITGTIARNNNCLSICYRAIGNLSAIAIAPSANTPTRKHELWEDTCFEFFLGIKNSDRYWEFNLSPAGHWNVYRFEGYRQGMQLETALTTLPYNVERRSDSLQLTLTLDLDKIVSPDQKLEVAITTVIKQEDEEVTYWALSHKGAEADFHLRDSFIIEL